MTIELSMLIAIVSFAFAMYQGVVNIARNKKTDDKNDATQLTTVIVKLENIGMGISEIKGKMSNLETASKDHGDRIIRVEEKVKVHDQIWQKLNIIKGEDEV